MSEIIGIPQPRELGDRFSYACHACGRCCHGKLIQVNPYEVAELARHLGVSTTRLRSEFLDGSRSFLAHREEGACVFFSENKCTVHSARPLVCRLYPLGVTRSADGTLSVASHRPHPRSEGVYGREGTVQDWIRHQQAEEFLRSAEAYHALLVDLAAALQEREDGTDAAEVEVDLLMDLDATIAAYCRKEGRAEPQELGERRELHIAIMREVCGLKPANPKPEHL